MPPRQGTIDKEQLAAGILRIYLYFRLLLALAILGSYAGGLTGNLFGQRFAELFLSSAIFYVVIAAIMLGFYELQGHRLTAKQLFFTLLSDVVIQTLLMFCSGGLASGLGYLMLVTVAVGAIFFTGQLALLIPAIASIGIILESIIGSSVFDRNSVDVFPAGILGVLLFASSLIFTKLSSALVDAQQVIRTTTALSAGLQELNQMIIERMRTGIIVVDNLGTIQQINTAAREMLGRRSPRNPLSIGDGLNGESGLLKRLAAWRRHPELRPKPFVPRLGSAELQASFANLETAGGDRTIIFLEDLRAQIQHAEQLKLASLGRLTGSIAHEIRNPLGAISHASELLNEIRHDNPTATRLTEIINTQVKRVNHIVESILQLSRKQDHHLARIDLPSWLEGFLNDYRLGNRNGPRIDLDITAPILPLVTFDSIHLVRVLTNLLDNAIRYSHAQTGEYWAGIRITVSQEDNIVTLDVVDRGTGVPPTSLNQLFEPFYSTSPGGSGLGLYIARELCAINYATIAYQGPQGDDHGFFRISFVHPDKVLKISEEGHDNQQSADH